MSCFLTHTIYTVCGKKVPIFFLPVILRNANRFLANVNSSSRSLYVIVRPSVVCRLSVVCNVRIKKLHLKFSAMFLRHRVPWPSIDIQVKFYEDRPRGTHPSGELNKRGVAEYSDFGPIDGYISETVQDRRYVTINHQ